MQETSRHASVPTELLRCATVQQQVTVAMHRRYCSSEFGPAQPLEVLHDVRLDRNFRRSVTVELRGQREQFPRERKLCR